ncbi:hypothetical protein AB0L88_44365 [Saccharopolyspora shandongensis]|uniref:Uncharacterized protein n=1 Tax=Saccharopolyspora shandongensis TaxID=418495 RepID=A0A1H3LH23_9PSEU|nr:hypothetical protein [Saccharopolyspora shandongensis]SDY63234.1 hypothetical protein SAMN05216215_103150 [Saccharopolyspora shandongensis]
MSGSLFSPTWLGPAVSGVLDRLDDQVCELIGTGQPRSADRLDGMAALYERQARCWRILAAHTHERVVWKAMLAAQMHAESFAEDYRGFAESKRRFEAAAAERTSGGAAR